MEGVEGRREMREGKGDAKLQWEKKYYMSLFLKFLIDRHLYNFLLVLHFKIEIPK